MALAPAALAAGAASAAPELLAAAPELLAGASGLLPGMAGAIPLSQLQLAPFSLGASMNGLGAGLGPLTGGISQLGPLTGDISQLGPLSRLFHNPSGGGPPGGSPTFFTNSFNNGPPQSFFNPTTTNSIGVQNINGQITGQQSQFAPGGQGGSSSGGGFLDILRGRKAGPGGAGGQQRLDQNQTITGNTNTTGVSDARSYSSSNAQNLNLQYPSPAAIAGLPPFQLQAIQAMQHPQMQQLMAMAQGIPPTSGLPPFSGYGGMLPMMGGGSPGTGGQGGWTPQVIQGGGPLQGGIEQSVTGDVTPPGQTLPAGVMRMPGGMPMSLPPISAMQGAQAQQMPANATASTGAVPPPPPTGSGLLTPGQERPQYDPSAAVPGSPGSASTPLRSGQGAKVLPDQRMPATLDETMRDIDRLMSEPGKLADKQRKALPLGEAAITKHYNDNADRIQGNLTNANEHILEKGRQLRNLSTPQGMALQKAAIARELFQQLAPAEQAAVHQYGAYITGQSGGQKHPMLMGAAELGLFGRRIQSGAAAIDQSGQLREHRQILAAQDVYNRFKTDVDNALGHHMQAITGELATAEKLASQSEEDRRLNETQRDHDLSRFATDINQQTSQDMRAVSEQMTGDSARARMYSEGVSTGMALPKFAEEQRHNRATEATAGGNLAIRQAEQPLVDQARQTNMRHQQWEMGMPVPGTTPKAAASQASTVPQRNMNAGESLADYGTRAKAWALSESDPRRRQKRLADAMAAFDAQKANEAAQPQVDLGGWLKGLFPGGGEAQPE